MSLKAGVLAVALMTPTRRVLDALESRGLKVMQSGNGWRCQCPAHDDRNPSLSVTEGDDGRVLLNCHAGCTLDGVLRSLDLTGRDLFPHQNGTTSADGVGDTIPGLGTIKAVYRYHNAAGTVVYEAVRFEPKDFRLRRPLPGGGYDWKVKGVPRVPYRLPEVLKAPPGETIWVCEGERDCDTLRHLGLVATTNPMGAGKWHVMDKEVVRQAFAGRPVVVLSDNDAAGRKHVRQVAEELSGTAAEARVLELPNLPPSGDVTDWVQAGGTKDELIRLSQTAPVWQAAAQGPATGQPAQAHAEPRAAVGRPRVVLESLAHVRARPVRYLVPGRVPVGKLMLVAGDGGAGKSTLMRHFAACITAGRPAFGLDYPAPPPGDVVLLSGEDGWDDVVVPSLVAEGADLARVHRVPYVVTEEGGKLVRVPFTPVHLEHLKEELRARPGVKVVVIDPIASLVGKARIDDHRASELRLVLDPLVELAEELGVTVIVIAHLSKNAAAKAVHRIMGSVSYTAASRLAYLVGEDPDDPDRRLLVPVKKNLLGVEATAVPYRLHPLTPDEARGHRGHPAFRDLTEEDFDLVRGQMARVEFDPSVHVQPDQVFGAAQKDTAGQMQKCKDWLRERLGRFAWPDKEVLADAKAAGFTFKTYRAAKAELNEEADLHCTSRGSSDKSWWLGFGQPITWVRRPDSGQSGQSGHSGPRTEADPEAISLGSAAPSGTEGQCERNGQIGQIGRNDGPPVPPAWAEGEL